MLLRGCPAPRPNGNAPAARRGIVASPYQRHSKDFYQVVSPHNPRHPAASRWIVTPKTEDRLRNPVHEIGGKQEVSRGSALSCA